MAMPYRILLSGQTEEGESWSASVNGLASASRFGLRFEQTLTGRVWCCPSGRGLRRARQRLPPPRDPRRLVARGRRRRRDDAAPVRAARRALLLIDGLDEGGQLRSQIEMHVIEVLAPQGHPLLITSRPAGIEETRFAGFRRLLPGGQYIN